MTFVAIDTLRVWGGSHLGHVIRGPFEQNSCVLRSFHIKFEINGPSGFRDF